MDTFEALRDQVSKITVYDIKSMYNQAKNMVLNVSEIEAKVQEATNDEPWGASSSLMQEIAQGTFNFQQFNEIMPAIYSRFMDKDAREWRQIYKALQLLEYLVKHGSERVVDDARSHLATLKMLRNFHYIDERGKDQGINVRQRSKEIVDLLSDLEKVRQERRKAKANRNKYIGTGNDSTSFSSSGGRYGGYGSDSIDHGGSSGYGGGGGGYSGGFRDRSRKQDFEEYDAGEWEGAPRRSTSTSQPAGGSGSSRTTTATTTQPAAKSEPKASKPPKVQNLLDFDDDSWGPSTSAPAPVPTVAAPTATAPKPAASNDFDDFDDFQSAPSVTTATAPVPTPSLMATPALSPAPASKPAANVFDLLNATRAAPSSPATAGRPPVGYGQGSAMVPSPVSTFAPMKPATPTTPAPAIPTKATSGGGFDDLWTMSLGGSKSPAPAAGSTTGKTIQDLQREKASQAFWGAGTGAHKPGSASIGGGHFAAPAGADDLLL